MHSYALGTQIHWNAPQGSELHKGLGRKMGRYSGTGVQPEPSLSLVPSTWGFPEAAKPDLQIINRYSSEVLQP